MLRETFVQHKGIASIATALRCLIDDHGSQPSAELLCLLRLVLDAIVPEKESMATFVDDQAIDILLTLIETTHSCHYSPILTIMAEILGEVSAARTAFAEWRSPTSDRSAAIVLFSIWKEIEDSSKTPQTVRILCQNLCARLFLQTNHVNGASTLAMDLSVNFDVLRRKIYVVFSAVGYDGLQSLPTHEAPFIARLHNYEIEQHLETLKRVRSHCASEGLLSDRQEASNRFRVTSLLTDDVLWRIVNDSNR